MSNGIVELLYAAFALGMQLMLVGNFAARVFDPTLERDWGWIVYAMGVPSLALAVLVLVTGGHWMYGLGPALYAVWSAFGYVIDIRLRLSWRSPKRLSLYVPYVTLFITGLLATWIPLWYVGIAFWALFGVLYVISTSLNIYSHRLPTWEERISSRVS